MVIHTETGTWVEILKVTIREVKACNVLMSNVSIYLWIAECNFSLFTKPLVLEHVPCFSDDPFQIRFSKIWWPPSYHNTHCKRWTIKILFDILANFIVFDQYDIIPSNITKRVFVWLAKCHLYATITLPRIRLLCLHLQIMYGEMFPCTYSWGYLVTSV